MEFSFIKYDYMIKESELYDTKVNYEKIFMNLTDDIKNYLNNFTDYLYKYFKEILKNNEICTLGIDCVKKIDNIPIKLHFYIIKNFKRYNMENNTIKLGFNICISESEHINKLNYDLFQDLYILNVDIKNENIFKNYIYNICFYCYIVMKDFKYNPLLTYLNHSEDINDLINLKKVLINLFGEKLDCSVCMEQTLTTTECNHSLCQKCFCSLQKKICPICRTNLNDDNLFNVNQIDIFL